MPTNQKKRRTLKMPKKNEFEQAVTLHIAVPLSILAVIKPAAEAEALRLTTWCRRVIILAARERQSRAASAPTN
jgi:hypothetical protein